MVKNSLLALAIIFASNTLMAKENNTTTKSTTTKEISKSKSIAQAKALFDAMNLDKVYKFAVENATRNTIAFNPQAKGIEDKIRAYYEKTIGWKSIRDDIAKIYAKYYTLDELKKLTELYKTPLGKKVLDVTPKITVEGQKLLKERLAKHFNELKDMMSKLSDSNNTKESKKDSKK